MVGVVELGDNIGLGFDNGQNTRCEFGYGDAFDAQGFPAPLAGGDVRLFKKVRGGADQWGYSSHEDSSAYLSVFTRNADGTQGSKRCWGESKTMFNYEGK